MALYGKVGDQVVIRENINTLINNPVNNKQPMYQQGPIQVQSVQQNVNVPKMDYTRFIRLSYHNPGSVDIASNANAMRDDYLNQLKTVRAPDLGNMQRILESCDSMKQDYNNYMALNIRLDDILKNKPVPAPITNIGMMPNPMQGSGYMSGNNFPNNYIPSGNAEAHLPPKQKGYNEFDVQKFIAKFKCAREMAVGYLEAFQNYNEAEKQFILNTGWKG